MKTLYKYIAIAFATLLCSCNEEITPDVNESQVQISANITPCVLTRVTEDGKSFTDGDVIKVQNIDRENKNLATYTYSESTGKWSASEDLYWDGEAANTFNAWYPATAAYDSFTIPADQTSGTASADWMTATTSAKKADGAVNLSFNHHLSKITVTIDSWSNEYLENEKVANSLELRSLSDVMSNDGAVSGDDVPKWVKAYIAQANTSFVAIIAPATYASGDNIMQIYVNGSATPLAVKTSSALAIESGKAYRFKLSVGKNLAEITSDVTVDAWDDETLDDQLAIPSIKQTIEYIDEYGINHGEGIEIDGIVWAPVNCGYHATDYKYGKLYQWGRKYGQGYDGSLYNFDGDNYSTYSDANNTEIESGPVGIDVGQAKNNENIYYYNSSYPYDWCTTRNDNLWNSGTEENPIKTEFDPCPYGWRVPTNKELKELCKNYSEWTENEIGQIGYWFSGACEYSLASSKIFLPAAGILYNDGNANQRNYYGEYWSSKNNSDHDAYALSLFNTRALVNTSHYRAYGYSVRCVQDKNIEEPSESQILNLSSEGTANSYIVSEAGSYKFSTVKGNSSESVGAVASAEVLWETFGTDVTPNVGDLVKNAVYSDGYIAFQTADTFKEGNAVIAAKDASGNILWSWHIWLTDEPQGQVYYNNAGTMMDRNLGATSTTPGDVGALGLLYQWGRKDPFLGSSSVRDDVEAKSTLTWPSTVMSNSSNGTIEYAATNPTTFITSNSNNSDWYYTGDSSIDNTRWTPSETTKSIYDPCPAGWRVPDGGSNGVWSKSLGSSSHFDNSSSWDSTNEGMNFSGKFGSASTIWYPASGFRHGGGGSPYAAGYYGFFWSSSPNGYSAYFLSIYYGDGVDPANYGTPAAGRSVRCLQEGTTPSTPAPEPVPEAVDLSAEGTANSYIVSQKGTYKFSTVKGNSSESVGAVASAEALWESFGTDVTPNVGDLVKNAVYSDGYITFQTSDTFKEGNAVIAAKDASGTILWSWHIWLTDEPQGQEYYNNAGTMMDRNLGATSATPGDVGALGLLYQWGRKDPFLGSSSISEDIEAASTITWPSDVESNSTNGTIEYASANPTTFITNNSNNYYSNNYDWYYTGDKSTDETRWTESEKAKSIYDPCPHGWRVPDGGADGIWSIALGSSDSFSYSILYDGTNEGMNFSGKFGSASTIWYPTSGFRGYNYGGLAHVGFYGYYWSASPFNSVAYCLRFSSNGIVNPSYDYYHASGYSVRCVRVIDEVAGANAEE